VTVNPGSTTASTLTASTTTPVLTKATLTATSVTFTATAPSYGYSASITNTLQMDVHSDNFAKPKKEVVLPTGTLTQTYNVFDFNNILLGMGLPSGASAQVDVRIKSSLSATSGIVYSNVVTLTVTPFALISYLYVPGAYEGWSNPGPQEDSLCSVTGNGVYVGIINFTAGNNQFLVTPKKTWDNKYATNDPSSTAGTSSNYSVTYNGSNNFYAPTTAGYYMVTLNTNNNTMTIVPANYYSIIGDAAQGWGTDVAMKYINDGSGNWSLIAPLVSSGQFKVRQNFDWTFSWGIPKSGSAGFGVANTLNNTSNDNISVAANGNYLVKFNSPAVAVGTTPPVTTTYSAVKQ
jgi:hypothetical protein